ncbi:uncharacterized protein EI90DRAFT_2202515 [Cantharellus anzutake]|uniref:uncharacterized protein n=1 Tax=Cantharellus anzutake TaxID=1750568 RepID=UPI0019063AC7|nr:uncharacterized protein EI90DRAFT_2202515 [Cantharellus anzutake]KAF8324964.1 hypothetical protein EI90DRAFT_2202515 [Cantharellus anzutake]
MIRYVGSCAYRQNMTRYLSVWIHVDCRASGYKELVLRAFIVFGKMDHPSYYFTAHSTFGPLRNFLNPLDSLPLGNQGVKIGAFTSAHPISHLPSSYPGRQHFRTHDRTLSTRPPSGVSISGEAITVLARPTTGSHGLRELPEAANQFSCINFQFNPRPSRYALPVVGHASTVS